ncbi:response regulator [Mariniblastus fucicola]|uniref:Hydrogenase transcriptional regulatory protein hupR1 n=1 Tax=Mariniblastus fucicola TaxID=980251 RepID=A0A5B9PK44_9BACT|nr:response regulator [Mariniblastus fucicola]QEG23031.1 Hydrogenase transcriptional regulatory protein hupR1 [Mariniblastus fucicola]
MSKTTRIVFVDDDPMLLASTRRQLRRKIPNCEMLFFERAAEALDAIAETPANVVLSDLRMPEMDGDEFLAQVADLHPDTVRLAWTGQSEAAQLKRVLNVADRVFSKPCPTQTLIDIIRIVNELCHHPPQQRLPLLLAAFDELEVDCFLQEHAAATGS